MITITSWNVQNFAQDDPVFADKLNFVAGMLQALGSDVVALQEILDHVLASQGLMPRVGGLRQVPTVTILNAAPPNLIGAHPIVGGTVPDHAPVTARFV